MKRTLLEIGKIILILVLTAAILALALLGLPQKTLASTPWLTELLRPFAGFFGLSEAALRYTALPNSEQYAGASQPTAITVMGPTGRCTLQGGFPALDEAYEQLGSALSMALDTAEEPKTVSAQRLREALSQTGAAFFYPSALPVEVLASWLSVRAPVKTQAQVFVLTLEQDTVWLYLYGSEVVRLSTRLSPDILTGLCASYLADGSFFAFEDPSGLYRRAEPMSLITQQTQYPRFSSQNPCDARLTDALASSLGFNPYGDGRYTDETGTEFYNDTDASLRISASGQLTFRPDAADARYAVPEDTDAARIEAARALISDLLSGTDSAARLYLTGYACENGEAQCTFSYFLSGCPVHLAQEPAALAEFSGGRMTLLQLTLRKYTAEPGAEGLLPPAQAAAILPQGAPLCVVYDDLSGPVPGWSAG